MTSIAYLVNDIRYFFSHRMNLAKAAQSLGWAVHVIVPSLTVKDHERLSAHGFIGHVFLPKTIVLKQFFSIFKLIGIIKAIDPNLVHVVTLKNALRWFLTLIWTRKIKTVHTIAGFGQLAGQGFIKNLARRIVCAALAIMMRVSPSLYVVQNESDADHLRRFAALPKTRLFLVPGSGVDPKRYAPREPKSAHTNGFLHVGTACRRLMSKGLVPLMALARRIHEDNLPIKIHVASVPAAAGHPEAIDPKLWDDWRAQGLFIDAGMVEDMPRYYQSLDTFIYLSESGEGLAKTLLEAGACGLPILTTAQPGCGDAIIHEQTGYVIDPYDTNHILVLLMGFYHDPNLRAVMGQASRVLVQKRFCDDIIIDAMLILYDKAMELQ